MTLILDPCHPKDAPRIEPVTRAIAAAIREAVAETEAENKRLREAFGGLIQVTEEALGRLDSHDVGLVGGEDELRAARAALKGTET